VTSGARPTCPGCRCRSDEPAPATDLLDLRELVDGLPSMVGYWDEALTCRFANHAYRRWFDVDPQAILGCHIRDLLGEKIYAANRLYIEAALRGETQVFERAIPHPDGSGIRHSLAHYLPHVVDGRSVGFYVLVHDVTDLTVSRQRLAAVVVEHENLLHKLEREHQRLDDILRGTNVGTWEWNVQTGEFRISESWAGLIGHARAELAPLDTRSWFERIHDDDAALARELLTRHFARELDLYECEVRVRHRRGAWVWVLDRGRVTTWTASGEPEWMHGTRQDISRRKEAERRLAASEAFLERAGRLASVGGWQVDLESGSVTWTSETLRLLDVPPGFQPQMDSMIGFYDPEARPRIVAAIAELRARGGSFDLELPLTTAAGRRLWVRTIGELEYTSGDEARPHLLTGAIQDITARHAADTALREATRAAEAASAAKSEFLANMSHEIRTPLHAILGMTHLMDRSRLDDEQRQFVRSIQLAGQGLLGIVNDVLDLAKIEAGGVKLDLEVFDLRATVADITAMLGPQAVAKRLELAVEVAVDLPSAVEGDVVRVRQILVNLLSNAIKFTAEGSVRLTVTIEERADAGIRVRFTVRDTGIGVAAVVQTAVFRPFIQADASTTRRFGGTGLGLSIVRGLVARMGGEVGLRSEVGRGSEFWATVWLGVPAAATSASTGRPTPRAISGSPRLVGVRVLVVDDNEINRDVAERVLVTEGAVVTTGADGTEALVILRAAPDAFDIVLMDIQMPVLDGNATTIAIRRELGLDLPILAVTASALVAERRRSLDAGMNDVITKPLHPDTLIQTVQHHTVRRARNQG
jgi:PAS domain S-box-containing protein